MEKQKKKTDWVDRIWTLACLAGEVFRELYLGIATNTIAWTECLLFGVVVSTVINLRLDYLFFKKLQITSLYPTGSVYWTYFFTSVFSGFFFWGLMQVGARRQLVKQLTEIFTNAKLVTASGRLPGYIFDRPIDEHTRKLRLSRVTLPLVNFQKSKPNLEAGLNIYIDEMREQRDTGTIDIIYSHDPMPSIVTVDDFHEFGPWKFLVGRTRAKPITVDLRKVPHMLIAGQTGGGKSTFLRQLITTLYLNNKDSKFLLIDLKGGLEFQLFENTKRIDVLGTVDQAVTKLSTLDQLLDNRMKLLKQSQCKDMEAYLEKMAKEDTPRKTKLVSYIVVIDEAAEMFLAGEHASGDKILTARRALSKLARQGRSVGVHLIIATQRPDSRALDSQVKANLPGVLCFQMQNDASSITVLGNGRATELPPIPGRGIFKNSMEMVEVQTPLLEVEKAEALLKDYRKNPPKTADTQTSQPAIPTDNEWIEETDEDHAS